jgi:hypothetical protein
LPPRRSKDCDIRPRKAVLESKLPMTMAKTFAWKSSAQQLDVSGIASLRKRLGRAAASLKIIGFPSALPVLVYSQPFGGLASIICALLTPGCAFLIAKRLRSGSTLAVTCAAAWFSLYVGLLIFDGVPKAWQNITNVIDAVIDVFGIVFLFVFPTYFFARGLFTFIAYRSHFPTHLYIASPLALHPWEEGLRIKKRPRFITKKSVLAYVLLAFCPLPFLFVWLSQFQPDPTDFSDAVRTASYSITLLALELATLALGVRIYRRARRAAMLPGSTLVEKDRRAIVLYLRSFQDDRNIKVRARASNGRTPLERFVKIPFEELVTDHLWQYGPVLALGEPETKGRPAPLGAARDYPSEASWEEHVTELMLRASMIVAIAGRTYGLSWEIDRIVRLGLVSKLVILLPPGDFRALNTRWQFLAANSLLGTIAPLQIDRVDIRAVVFGEGQAVFISGNEQNDWTYETVLDAAALSIENNTEGSLSVSPNLPTGWRAGGAFRLVYNLAAVLTTMIIPAIILTYALAMKEIDDIMYSRAHPYSKFHRDWYVTTQAAACHKEVIQWSQKQNMAIS